jgi:ribosomal protein L11 methyltransferase
MKYYKVKFTLSEYAKGVFDVLAALAGETGFESFEMESDKLVGYVQQVSFNQKALNNVLDSFPYKGVKVDYEVSEAENKDWNQQWEEEGFAPIIITGNGNKNIVIHDGRHLPECLTEEYVQIEIDAKLAFGTGTHETTRMICHMLMDYPAMVNGKRVLDCGCGTGILGIAAMKLGAKACTAYDIDEWSVENSRHNSVLNQVNITLLQGDASILSTVKGKYNLIMANINRNILLADMPAFYVKMDAGASLILSGFYEKDAVMIAKKANELGLKEVNRKTETDWCCLLFTRPGKL